MSGPHPRPHSHCDGRGEQAAWRDGAALAALTALVGAVAWNRLLFDAWLTRFDMFTFFLPWYTFLGERIRALAVPGWNPHLFSGAPFAGDPESGWMYAPAMLFFALLPTLAAFKGMVVVQLAVAALSTYALARALGMGAMAALTAGAIYVTGPFLHWNTHCCLIFSQFAAWIPLALLAVELGLRAGSWRGRIAAWFLGGLAVSQLFGGWVGEGWLYAVLLPAAYIAYRAVLSPPRLAQSLKDRLTTAVATGFGVLGSGLALAAAGMLPRLAVNAETNLAGGDYSALGDAGILNPPWGWDYLLAQTLGIGSGYHFRAASFGGAAVVLSLLALVMSRRRLAAPFFAGLTLVAMLLTLAWTPLHELFYLIPRFRQFHDHDAWRTISLAAIGPAMLSGAAIEALPAWRGRRDLLPVVFIPFGLLLLVDGVLRRRDMALGSQPLVAALLTTLLVAIVVALPEKVEQRQRLGRRGDARIAGDPRGQDDVPRHTVGPRPTGDPGIAPTPVVRFVSVLILTVALIIPTGLELTGSWLGWPANDTWEETWQPDPNWEAALRADVRSSDPGGAGEFLQRQVAESGPFRYAGYGGFGYPGDEARAGSYMGRRFDPAVKALLVNGRSIYLGLYDVQGYNPLHLARYDDFITALNGAPQDYHTAFLLPSGLDSPLLDLLNVRYVAIDSGLPRNRDDVRAVRSEARAVFTAPRVSVYERRADLPHAWIVHDVRKVARGEALPLLTGGDVDPYLTALVEGMPPETEAPPDNANESAQVISYAPDGLAIATDAAAPGLLIVSEVYASGWRAFVDGDEVPIYPTHHVLRGVPIPAGQHTVALRYDPLALRIGLWVSGIAGVAMLASFAAAGWTWVSKRVASMRIAGTPSRPRAR